jgi:hypothetical protein
MAKDFMGVLFVSKESVGPGLLMAALYCDSIPADVGRTGKNIISQVSQWLGKRGLTAWGNGRV